MSNGLTPEQETALKQLKANVQDVLRPEQLEDDRFLLRWLRARDFDVKKTEKMLRDSMQWRKQNNIDTFLQNYEMPEVLRKYYSLKLLGADKQGHPVWLTRSGKNDFKGMLNCLSINEMSKIVTYCMEESQRFMREQTKKLGRPIETNIFIMDMDEFSMKQVTSRQVIGFLRLMVSVNDNNYPESLKKVVIINASKIFQVAYSLVKPFMHENTISKIEIFSGPDSKKWKDVLLQDIDAEILPPHWGGIRSDGSGDPCCIKLISPGGEIPKKYLSSPGKKLAEVDGVETITVSSGSSALVEADINEPGSILKWIFGTDHDIGFGVYRRTDAGLEEHLPKGKVSSHVVAEEGELECIEAGTYVLAFDNTHSFLRSKKVTFRVEVLPPEDEELTMRL